MRSNHQDRGAGPGWHKWVTRVLSVFVSVLLAACASDIVPNPNAALNLPREDWWGGPAYYSAFPKAASSGWTDPSFFPIAVFQGKPEDAASLRSIGVNTYMGAEHDGSTMSSITATGMFVLAQSEWTPSEVGDDPKVVGWNISDECDMGYSGCKGDEDAQLARQRRYAAAARAHDDGRFLQANFGNGVLGTFWSKNTMVGHVELVDVTSVDKYAYTSPHVRQILTASPYWPQGMSPESAGAYGWLQTRMATFSNPPGSKPNWVFIETAKPYLTETGATSITPEQLEGAVWNALIRGAAGIAYFQHNNNGTCGNYSLMNCDSARAAVAKVNGQVQQLAQVLNTQSQRWDFGSGLATALKVHDGYAYVLAMTDGGSGERKFTLPSGLRGNSVEVVGEGRTLAVSSGSFTDTFATEATHHIYRILI